MNDWPLACLDECCQIVSGGTPNTSIAEYWGGDIPWATPKDLGDLTTALISDTPRRLTAEGLAASSASLLPAGSVLFSSRAPIGYVAINVVPMATNQGFKSFVPKPDLLYAPYLYWWLRTNRTYLQGLGNGATFKELSKSVVSRVEIPLPPLPEQRRIASILDKVDGLLAKRRGTLAQLDKLTLSTFIETFGNPLSNPLEWPVRKLVDVATTTSGGTPDRGNRALYGGSIPWVKSGELVENEILTSEEAITEVGLRLSPAKLMPKGSVLVAMYGATAGQVSMLGIEAATNQAICSILPGPELRSEYLLMLLRIIMPSFLSRRVGGAQPNLSQGMIRSILLPLPPLAWQEEYCTQLRRIRRLETDACRSMADLKDLFASLQLRAFRGDL